MFSFTSEIMELNEPILKEWNILMSSISRIGVRKNNFKDITNLRPGQGGAKDAILDNSDCTNEG